jgi:hypothetical protein
MKVGVKVGKYGEVALKSLYIFNSENLTLEGSWKKACKEIFENSKSSQNKGCPKNAFLGLCSEGLVKNIPKGNYTKSEKNKNYALLAVDILKKNKNISNMKILWEKVTKNEVKHNMQMDVVLTLWNSGYIL